MTPNTRRVSGRVAIVEIAATDTTPAVYAVEVALEGETLTLSDQNHDLSDETRALAAALIQHVRTEYHDHQ